MIGGRNARKAKQMRRIAKELERQWTSEGLQELAENVPPQESSSSEEQFAEDLAELRHARVEVVKGDERPAQRDASARR